MTKTSVKARPRNPGKMTTSRKNLPTSKPSRQTKKSQLIRLLNTKAGADAASISKKFGWLPHTTRAALSGLRKAGYEISGIKSGAGKPKRYHISGVPSENTAQ